MNKKFISLPFAAEVSGEGEERIMDAVVQDLGLSGLYLQWMDGQVESAIRRLASTGRIHEWVEADLDIALSYLISTKSIFQVIKEYERRLSLILQRGLVYEQKDLPVYN